MMLRINLRHIYLINKFSLANFLFVMGVALAFYESLHPWFLWFLGPYAYLLTAFCLIGYVVLVNTVSEVPAINVKYLPPFIAYALIQICIFLVNPDATFMAFISIALQIASFFVIFRADGELLRNSMLLISKSMAIILCFSIFGFVLYLVGYNLPYVDARYGEDLYSFSNYFLFLIDDRSLFVLIPRFQSVFLEPSHMAIASVFLLMLDCGKWKRWYNIVHIVAVIISFSLEAYVLLFCLIFLSKWIQHKNFIRNLIIIISLFLGVVIGSFYYQNGDNMFNSLIVMRLEMEDGEVAGNNRTTGDFDAEYDNFINSSDVLFGRDMYDSFGNSGYKVFIYENGLVNLVLLFIFYAIILYNPQNKKAAFTAFVLTLIHFIVRAHMMWASCILPMYCMAQFFNNVASGNKTYRTDD